MALAGVAATTSLGFNGASVGLLWWTVFLVLITNTVFTLSVVNGTFVAQRGVVCLGGQEGLDCCAVIID